MSIDVLLLELPRSDRDLNLTVPVYLELKRRGYDVVLENLHFSYLHLVRHRPKLVFFSSLNDSVVIQEKKLLHELGIPVISMTCEGNFQEIGFHGYFWGWNRDYKFYQDRLLLWNEHSRELIVRKHPEFASRLEVTGSVGHDRYRNLAFQSKAEFLAQRGLPPTKRVVGLAGFGLFKYIHRPEYVTAVDPQFPIEQFRLFERDLEILRDDYRRLVRDNPDVLFIARVHPELAGILDESEFAALIQEPNVVLSSIYGELKSIDDVLSICDVWIAYETNSSIEAWLLGKPVIYYNPTTVDFQRENHYRAVLVARDLRRLQDALDELWQTGRIADYDALAETRREVLQHIVGFSDGRNYVRTADAVERHLRSLRTESLPLRYAQLLARKRTDIFRGLVWNQDIYWEVRRDLKRPDRMFYPATVFGEHYVRKYSNVIR